jgi:hypothetical protein
LSKWDQLRYLVPLWLSRILLVLLALFKLIPPGSGLTLSTLPLIGTFARWDSGFYITIASSGYVTSRLFAFRPLYPLILKALTLPFGPAPSFDDMTLVGFAWNIVMLTVLGIYLFKLTTRLLGEDTARRSVVLLAIYPSTVFLSAIYPETTYLLLVVLTFYFIEEEKLVAAGALSFLASIMRPEGFLLFIPFAAKAFLNRESESVAKYIVASAPSLLGAAVFLLYSGFVTGNFLVPLQAESTSSSIKLSSVITSGVLPKFGAIGWFNILIMAMACVFLILAWSSSNDIRKNALPYLLWATGTALTFILAGDIISWSRFSLTLVPVLWGGAYLARIRKNAYRLTLLIYFLSMVAASALFFNGYSIY